MSADAKFLLGLVVCLGFFLLAARMLELNAEAIFIGSALCPVFLTAVTNGEPAKEWKIK